MTARSARSDPQASKNNKQRQTPNKKLYARATKGSSFYPCRYVFAEQNGTTDEHRFTCVGVCVGKSKCGTVWNVAQRNGITGYSCCAVLEVGE